MGHHTSRFGRRPPMLALCLAAAACGPPSGSSPLIENLPSDGELAAEEFQSRVVERFPRGTPEAQLRRGLRDLGFATPSWFRDLSFYCETKQCAVLVERPDPTLGIAWTITWTTDENDRMREIQTGLGILN